MAAVRPVNQVKTKVRAGSSISAFVAGVSGIGAALRLVVHWFHKLCSEIRCAATDYAEHPYALLYGVGIHHAEIRMKH